MKKLLAILALLVSLPAQGATLSAEIETNGFGLVTMTLFDTPCERGLVLAQLKKEWHQKFQKAEAKLADGTILNLCWSGEGHPGYVFVLDENGISGNLPLELFAPSKKPQGI